MSETDYYDFDYYDDFIGQDAYCRYCGARNLTWHQLPDGRHQLLNPSGRVHNCKPFRATRVSRPEDFDIF
jgi:hypothetical protein